MRVLYASAGFTTHDRRFLRAIVAQGHLAWHVRADAQPTVELPHGVQRWPEPLRADADWKHTLCTLGIDVIHAGPIPTVAAVVADIAVETPLAVMSWGSDILLEAARDQQARDSALHAVRNADAILCDCDAVMSQIRSWLPELTTSSVQFPWGLEWQRFELLPREESRRLRQSLGWDHCTVFIATRAWEQHYGVETLVEAFAEVAQERTDVRMLLLGDGSLRERVDALVERHGLRERIHRPGRCDENALPAWFVAADVYVSASLCDGTSVSLLEAFACELPAIVHDGGGNLEWVEDGQQGWLADCRDASQLAATLKLALSERHRWLQMGANNRLLARRRADWSQNSLGLTRAYEVAIAHRRRRFT